MADNLLDKASILLTPTAYDNGSMLSVKPENGDGDFTFSRNSAATRVNAQGLVENVQIISPELVSNGDFSQIGTEEVLNGNFSQEGSELITNGDFATDSDWTKGVGTTIESGLLNFADASSNTNQSLATTNAKIYKVVYVISNYSAGGILFRFTGIANVNGTVRSANGTYTEYIKATSSNSIFRFSAGAFTGSIDNVSVKEVGQNWTFFGEAELTSQGARIYSSSGGQSYIVQSVAPLTTSKSYKFSYEIKDSTQGSLKLINVNGLSDFPIPSTIGTHTVYFTADNSSFFVYRNSGVTDVTITNISVKEVGQNWSLGTGWSIGDGVAICDGTQTGNANIYQPISFVVGKVYKVTYELSNVTSGSAKIVFGDTGGTLRSSNGIFTEYYTFVSGSNFYIQGNVTFNGSIDNISVKEITDDTDIPRINYSGFSYQDTLGSEEIVNGDFSVDSNWTKGTGWSIGEDKAVCDGTQASNALIYQNIGSQANKNVKVSFTVTNYVSGVLETAFFGAAGTIAETISANGDYTFYIAVQSGHNGNTGFTAKVGFEGSIDNVSVKEVTGQEVVPDSGCGNWLLEPQSTNLLTYSEDFSDVSWTKISSTEIISNNSISPDGSLNSDKINASTTYNGILAFQDGFSVSSGSDYSISFFAKKGNLRYLQLFNGGNQVVGNSRTNFDLENGVVTVSDSGHDASIEDYGNGWFRCIVYLETLSTTLQLYFNAVKDANATRSAVSDFNENDNLFIWGAQLEQQSYATSYIPTSGATSTRLADVANNSGNASLINSTEGVLYAELKALSADGTNRYISLNDGTSSNRVNLIFDTNNVLKAFVTGSSSMSTSATITDNNKVAIKYKSGDIALWLNGVEVATKTDSISLSGLSSLSFNLISGTYKWYGKVKALAVYKEALTDAQLQSLTTI